MARLKRNGPRAAGTARRAGNVRCEKRTAPNSAIAPIEANVFARAWVARRSRARTRWSAVIAHVAQLGGRP
jgi:hypothetical protein